MIRKLYKAGNSTVVTLDKKMLASLGMDKDTYVVIEPDKKGRRIVIRKRTDNDW